MPEPLRFSILEDPDELSRLRPAWSELWRRDPTATPFQSPEWLIPWWRHFGEGELRVLTLCRAGQLTGIFPCYIYTSGQGPRKLLPLGVSTSDYIDGSFTPDYNPEDIAPGLELLLDDSGWDELWFPQLRPQSKLCAALRQVSQSTLCEHDADSTSRISSGPVAQLPRKLQKNVANYRNRAQRLGTLELVTAEPSCWQPTFDTLCALHAKRWHQAGKPGVLADPRVLAWHREAIPSLLHAGHARLASLRLNNETIAVLYSLIDPRERPARTQYCYLIGVSPDYGELSPGTLLLALTLEQAGSERIAAIDMLRGDEPYKQLWHPERVNLHAFSSSTPTNSLQTDP